ncbi:hypothetical protein [Chitinimonas lacunae]|uniref:Uncharacterized protein n=1 Tax=Chitinimonas lacunae TaxID=1963018 RepID=A0ABV8MSK0_9NEIS
MFTPMLLGQRPTGPRLVPVNQSEPAPTPPPAPAPRPDAERPEFA